MWKFRFKIFLNENFGFGLMSKIRLWSYSAKHTANPNSISQISQGKTCFHYRKSCSHCKDFPAKPNTSLFGIAVHYHCNGHMKSWPSKEISFDDCLEDFFEDHFENQFLRKIVKPIFKCDLQSNLKSNLQINLQELSLSQSSKAIFKLDLQNDF